MIKIYFTLLAILLSFTSHAQEITLDDINKRVLAMEKKYSIKFYIDFMPTNTWDTAYEFAQEEDFDNLFSYLELFDQEFSKYPLSFLRKSKLETIVFVKNLTVDGYIAVNKRGGVPDYIHELLIFDFTVGVHDKTYKIHAIHHEFYHMLEEQFNGDPKWKDPVWNSFNINNDVYGGRKNSHYSIIHPEKGFVSKYAISALKEDKAETFAVLFSRENYKKVKTWINEDDILFKKFEYLKNFLKGIDRSFTNEYWAKIQD